MGLALQKDDENNLRETVVLGLGETGFSVAKYLSKQHIAFKMMDTRTNPPDLALFKSAYPHTEVYLDAVAVDQLHKITEPTQLIVSPGVDINQDLLQQTIASENSECIGDIELFARVTNKPIVAITGSNGKSTVTSLLAEMARFANIKAYAGGNLGPPALDLLEHEDAELFVLELSSFQLETTHSLQAKVSAVLNISADHLDRHGSVENYAQIKEQIYNETKTSVVNRDDKYVSRMKTSGKVISFGLGAPQAGHFGVIDNENKKFLAFGKDYLICVSELALPGEAGILNSLAALAMGHAMSFPMQDMLETLKVFKGLPHRLALVVTHQEVSWFNDSKGTNIGATISSLCSLADNRNNIILIVGGVFKGGEIAGLKDAVDKHAKHVILIGQDAALLQEGLQGAVPVSAAGSMQEAVSVAQKLASKGDQVLLSPACASFDMYNNYIERGEDFENCVRGLLA